MDEHVHKHGDAVFVHVGIVKFVVGIGDFEGASGNDVARLLGVAL